jgi:hypothetical protein
MNHVVFLGKRMETGGQSGLLLKEMIHADHSWQERCFNLNGILALKKGRYVTACSKNGAVNHHSLIRDFFRC